MCYLNVRAFYFSSAIEKLLLRSNSCHCILIWEAKGFESGPQNIKADYFHATHDINKSFLAHSGSDSLVFEISGKICFTVYKELRANINLTILQQNKFYVVNNVYHWSIQWGELPGCRPPLTKPNLKRHRFRKQYVITVLHVVCFSVNQPLKSTDE